MQLLVYTTSFASGFGQRLDETHAKVRQFSLLSQLFYNAVVGVYETNTVVGVYETNTVVDVYGFGQRLDETHAKVRQFSLLSQLFYNLLLSHLSIY